MEKRGDESGPSLDDFHRSTIRTNSGFCGISRTRRGWRIRAIVVMGGCIAVAVFGLFTMRLFQESTDDLRYTMRKSNGVYIPLPPP